MKNIIFDFGNVLVQWHPEHVYGEYFGDEAKAWWFLRHVARVSTDVSVGSRRNIPNMSRLLNFTVRSGARC